MSEPDVVEEAVMEEESVIENDELVTHESFRSSENTRKKGRGFKEPKSTTSLDTDNVRNVKIDEPSKSEEGSVVFVTNIHPEAEESDVHEMFSEYGRIKDLQLNLDRKTGYLKLDDKIVENIKSTFGGIWSNEEILKSIEFVREREGLPAGNSADNFEFMLPWVTNYLLTTKTESESSNGGDKENNRGKSYATVVSTSSPFTASTSSTTASPSVPLSTSLTSSTGPGPTRVSSTTTNVGGVISSSSTPFGSTSGGAGTTTSSSNSPATTVSSTMGRTPTVSPNIILNKEMKAPKTREEEEANILEAIEKSKKEQTISSLFRPPSLPNQIDIATSSSLGGFIDPSNPNDRKRKEGVAVGLKNVGQICWFNVMMQALYNIPIFRNLILSKSHGNLKAYLNNRNGCNSNTTNNDKPDSVSTINNNNINGKQDGDKTVAAKSENSKLSQAVPSSNGAVGPENIDTSAIIKEDGAADGSDCCENDAAVLELLAELQILFVKLKYSKRAYVDPTAIVELFKRNSVIGRNSMASNDQEDVTEGITALMDLLEKAFKVVEANQQKQQQQLDLQSLQSNNNLQPPSNPITISPQSAENDMEVPMNIDSSPAVVGGDGDNDNTVDDGYGLTAAKAEEEELKPPMKSAARMTTPTVDNNSPPEDVTEGITALMDLLEKAFKVVEANQQKQQQQLDLQSLQSNNAEPMHLCIFFNL